MVSFSVLAFGCEINNEDNGTINSSTIISNSSSEASQTELSKEFLLGKWKSTEEDWLIEINVYENSETEQLQLDVIESNDKGTYTTASGYSSFFNEDKSISYSFSIYENQLTMHKNYIQERKDKAPSAIRPWILEK